MFGIRELGSSCFCTERSKCISRVLVDWIENQEKEKWKWKTNDTVNKILCTNKLKDLYFVLTDI